MKKQLTQLGLVLFAIVLLFGVGYMWRLFQAAGPAVLSPAYDVTEYIPPSDTATKDTGVDQSKRADLSDSDFGYTDVGTLRIPEGAELTVFAKDLIDARDILKMPNGTLLVSQPSLGQVTALIGVDGVLAEADMLADGFDDPHGLAMSCMDDDTCWLFVGDRDGVYRMEYDLTTNTTLNRELIFQHRTDGRHWRKTMVVAPYEGEERLFVKIASSCDVCFEEDAYRGTVVVMDLNGDNERIFSSGLRNAAFMAVHPDTGDIWVTEMGRDNLGDDLPPDEINILVDGGQYGWPICYGNNIHDTSFDKRQYIQDPCAQMTPPHITMQAHSAPLGLEFITEVQWPQHWQGDLLVAYHGSWNRSEPTGYKLVKYSLDDQGNAVGSQDIVSGWLDDGRAAGRPVDMTFGDDGWLYITDDKAGVVYRFGF